jgi:hypothetical protein
MEKRFSERTCDFVNLIVLPQVVWPSCESVLCGVSQNGRPCMSSDNKLLKTMTPMTIMIMMICSCLRCDDDPTIGRFKVRTVLDRGLVYR